jgi:hypothetical protein
MSALKSDTYLALAPADPPTLRVLLTRRALLAAALVIAVGACKDTDSAKPQIISAPANKPGAIAPAQRASVALPVFEINGKPIVVDSLSDDLELLSLKALPPIEDWQTLIVHGKDNGVFRGPHPMALVTKRTMKLVKQADGLYQFHIVESFHADGPRTRHRLDNVERVAVHTKGYEPPAVPTPPPSTAFLSVAGTQVELTEAMLANIKQTAEPGQEKPRDTWTLLDVLGKASLEKGQRVVLVSADDDEISVSAEQLQDATHCHLIKRNRRGELHYRDWTLGTSPTKTEELRNLVGIELR